jgi:hypothetical protein
MTPVINLVHLNIVKYSPIIINPILIEINIVGNTLFDKLKYFISSITS